MWRPSGDVRFQQRNNDGTARCPLQKLCVVTTLTELFEFSVIQLFISVLFRKFIKKHNYIYVRFFLNNHNKNNDWWTNNKKLVTNSN